MSEEPPPPTERSCQTAYLRDLLCEVEKNTFPSFCPSSKVLFDLICSLVLRLMIHFIFPPRPAAITVYSPTVCTRRPRHFTTPPLGLFELVRSSSAPPATAPLLLSTSVGRHNPRPRSTLEGQLLVEVFAAYSDFPFKGTITIFDGSASNYIYRCSVSDSDADADFYSQKKKWLTTHADSSEFKNKLLLTGPGRTISAFCGFSISASIHRHRSAEEYTACYDSPDDYCSMLNDPSTITITTNMGSLYVTCAVLSDAVQASLKVMVRLPWLYVSAFVHGHVMAYIGTFEIGTTIFSRDIDEPEDIPFTDPQLGVGIGTEFCLPLDRYPLVVPIGSCLHIKGELVLNFSETISINHSIPTESHFFETAWDEDEDFEIQTAVCLNLRSVWI
ncbi:hypothetical protein ACQ4PT_002516 [Festuca glaucescens]